MTSFSVDPAMLHGLANRLNDIVSDFESLSQAGLDLGDAGDSRVSQAIEHFVEQSRSGVGELAKQFGQIQQVLTSSVHGYEQADRHVSTEIDRNLSLPAGLSGGSAEGH